jgi:hypothetical protein
VDVAVQLAHGRLVAPPVLLGAAWCQALVLLAAELSMWLLARLECRAGEAFE